MNKITLSLPNSSALRIPLESDGVLSIRDVAGLTLEAICGRAWVTFKGERGDYLLAPGERISLSGRGAVVAQALGKAELRVGTAPAEVKPAAFPEASVARWRDQALRLAPYVSMERTF
jgi:hypothetical protein